MPSKPMSTAPALSAGPRSGSRPWTLALTSVAAFIVVLDSLVVITALPAIRREFGASLAALQWTVNAFTLAFASGIITGAALGDRFGRRRIFGIGFLIFTAASVACALSATPAQLIAARVVQGIGAAIVMPLSLTILTTAFPPVSLLLSYWMVGAFFMATKRYAEYRHIANPEVAAGYRKSFRHYTEEYLLLSIVFYATTSALFAGIFIVRYHLELILFVPLAAGMFTYYLRIGMRPNSPVQNPEKLYTERGFFAYMVVCFTIFVLLMFTRIPVLYTLFNVEQSQTSPLWVLGGEQGLK